jgi:hypothetical protein
MELNSAKYDLPSHVKLRVIGKNHIGIIKLIKSRIIQKDAAKIIEISKKLKKKQSEANYIINLHFKHMLKIIVIT